MRHLLALALALLALLPGEGSDAQVYRANHAVAIHESNLDAFSRLRISDPLTLFDSKLLHDAGNEKWDTYLTGTADSNYSATNSTCTLAVAAAGDTAIRQTFTRWTYQPGKSQLVVFTGAFLTEGTGSEMRVGLFDQNNGVFYLSRGDSLFAVIRNNGSDNEVYQGDWSYDTKDGTGSSGVTLDMSKTQIGFFDIEWLGVGRVRAGFVIDGIPVYVHGFNHANSLTTTYMSTPNLPVRYEVLTTDAAAEILQVCSTVISEGGVDGFGEVRNGWTDGVFTAATADSAYAVLGLVLQADKIDAMVKPLGASFVMTSADDGRFFWARNPTIQNTFSCSDVAGSVVQLCRGGDTAYAVKDTWDFTFGGGLIDGSGAGAGAGGEGSAEDISSFYLGSTVEGTPDTLALIYWPFTAGATLYPHITWQELR